MHSFNISASAENRRFLHGERLSFAGLKRALELVEEYASYTSVTVSVSTFAASPANILRFIPIENFYSWRPGRRIAAVVDLGNDDEDDDEEEAEDDEEEEEDDDEDGDDKLYINRFYS